MHVGLLDHRRQRLLGGASRLQEAWKIAAATQFRYPQLDGARSGFPVAVTIPVALLATSRRAFTVSGAADPQGAMLDQRDMTRMYAGPTKGVTDAWKSGRVVELFCTREPGDTRGSLGSGFLIVAALF